MMFCNVKKTSRRVLSWYKATRLRLVALYDDKTRPASLLNNFKNIPGKACFRMELITMTLLQTLEISIRKKITYEIIMLENQT